MRRCDARLERPLKNRKARLQGPLANYIERRLCDEWERLKVVAT